MKSEGVYIIGIDTSTNVCSVCLSLNGRTVQLIETADFKSHSEKVTLFVSECIERENIHLKDVSAVCVAEGPGSYTGLRIGAGCAKGLCLGLDIPLIGVNSLMALSYAMPDAIEEDAVILTAIDARRNEVYAAVFDNRHNVLLEPQAIVLDQDNALQQFQNEKIHLAGNGALKCLNFLDANLMIHTISSSSHYLSKPGYNHFTKSNFIDLITFSPFYLKNPNIILSRKSLI